MYSEMSVHRKIKFLIQISLVLAAIYCIACDNSATGFEAKVSGSPTFLATDTGYIFDRSAAKIYSRQASNEGMSLADEFLTKRDNTPYALSLIHMMLEEQSKFFLFMITDEDVDLTEPERSLVKAWAGIGGEKEDEIAYSEQVLNALEE